MWVVVRKTPDNVERERKRVKRERERIETAREGRVRDTHVWVRC